MERKYSIFLGNLGSCSDRYCNAYGKAYSLKDLFTRCKSIERIKGVDLVLSPELISKTAELKELLTQSELKVVSIAVDTFTQAKWKQGSFSSPDKQIRNDAVNDGIKAMDLAAELDCDLITVWPGQDGYDYIFQADYVRERTLFAEGIKELCRHRKDIKISLEFKSKEPRNHCYLNSTSTALLMINEVGDANCGAVLDFGHALLGYESPAESVALLKKYGDKLFHVHINDNYRLWDDDMISGSVHTLEYLEFFYWLKRTGYNGWITIDQFPYREDGRDAACESAEWLNGLERTANKIDLRTAEEIWSKKDAVSASRMMRELIFSNK